MLKLGLKKKAGSGTELKKRKKADKAKKFIGKGLKIVDEDTFLSSYNPPSESEEEDVEERPQIAAVVDERPIETQVLEAFNKGKWKRLETEDNQSKHDSYSKDESDEDHPARGMRGPGAISLRGGQGESEDMSPPRKRRDSGDMSPPRRQRNSEDMSPPRARRRNNSRDASPPRRRRNSGDTSPPRRRNDRRDKSPPRRRNDSGDTSPPRRRSDRRDKSPPRRRKNSGDASPPRRHKNRVSESPNKRWENSRSPKRSNRADSPDISPPRQRNRNQSPRRSNREFSPDERIKKRRRSTDISPRRSDKRVDSSPPRQRKRKGSDDYSPPRKNNPSRHHHSNFRGRDRSLAAPEVLDTTDDDDKRKTTLDGKKAGLQKAVALRDEMLEYRKRENEMFETLPDEVSGRNARAVVRDRRTEEDIEKEAEKERADAKRKEQYDKWGKGLKQTEEQAERIRSTLHEIAKPLARYKDDEDLDEHLKKQDRDGDPMLEYLAAKRRKARNEPEKPKYSGPPPPPNRFKVHPGYRWDGVDRSNGYEKEWFSRINAKKALQEEAYKWSVEDL